MKILNNLRNNQPTSSYLKFALLLSLQVLMSSVAATGADVLNLEYVRYPGHYVFII
jgi:hypothetical protein